MVKLVDISNGTLTRIENLVRPPLNPKLVFPKVWFCCLVCPRGLQCIYKTLYRKGSILFFYAMEDIVRRDDKNKLVAKHCIFLGYCTNNNTIPRPMHADTYIRIMHYGLLILHTKFALVLC